MIVRPYRDKNWVYFYYPILFSMLYFLAEIAIDLRAERSRSFFGSAWRWLDILTILFMAAIVALSYGRDNAYPSAIVSWHNPADDSPWNADFYPCATLDAIRRKFLVSGDCDWHFCGGSSTDDR